MLIFNQFRAFSFFLLIIFQIPIVEAQRIPSDMDGDGHSDLILAEIMEDSSLDFSTFNVFQGINSSIGSLGHSGDHAALAQWLSQTAPSIGVVGEGDNDALIWSARSSGGQVSTIQLGSMGDTVISGSDLDSSSLADAVAVRPGGRKLSWSIKTDPFGTSADKTASFGFSNEIPLFVRTNLGDRLATLRVGRRGVDKIRIYDFQTGTTRQIRLRRVNTRERPVPLAGGDGVNYLVYAIADGAITKLYLQALNSSIAVKEATINATGTLIVGDFLSSTGEEAAIHSGSTLYVYDRASGQVTEQVAADGIPIDEINVNTFPGGGATPTPSPTSPPGVTPTPGAPSAGLAAVCETTSAIAPGEMLIKSEASNHIGGGDPRTTGYTLVCGGICTKNLSYTQFFYANGEFAGAVAMYGRFSGNGQPRLYGAVGRAPQHFKSLIAAKAATIGNGKLYMQMSAATSGAGTSCKEFNPSGRNGSL